MIDTLTRLMGYCYADHVDSHLVSKGLSKLSTLQHDENLVAAYQNTLLDPNSVDKRVEHDVTAGKLSYSASLVFVVEGSCHGSRISSPSRPRLCE